jgi:hypothetical protein
MSAILSRSRQAVLLGALILAASPPAAEGNANGPYGGRRQVVLQVRGTS